MLGSRRYVVLVVVVSVLRDVVLRDVGRVVDRVVSW